MVYITVKPLIVNVILVNYDLLVLSVGIIIPFFAIFLYLFWCVFHK